MGDRVVDCARLESVCAERHRGFESPPIRHWFQIPIGIRFCASELRFNTRHFGIVFGINRLITAAPNHIRHFFRDQYSAAIKQV